MAQQSHGRKGSGMRQQCELLLNNNTTILLLQDRSSRWTFLFMSFSALAGFLLSLSPLSCMLMGWRGSSSNGATATGMYMFGGGGLLWFGGLGEWLVGNTFASVVFFAFGAFWLNFGAALIPSFNAYGSYSPSTEDPELGLLTVAYNSGWGRFHTPSWTRTQLHTRVLQLSQLTIRLHDLVHGFLEYYISHRGHEDQHHFRSHVCMCHISIELLDWRILADLQQQLGSGRDTLGRGRRLLLWGLRLRLVVFGFNHLGRGGFSVSVAP